MNPPVDCARSATLRRTQPGISVQALCPSHRMQRLMTDHCVPAVHVRRTSSARSASEYQEAAHRSPAPTVATSPGQLLTGTSDSLASLLGCKRTRGQEKLSFFHQGDKPKGI